jgi:hypothetical protein
MAKVGRIKFTGQEDVEAELDLTGEQATDLGDLLHDAGTSFDDLDADKFTGSVRIIMQGGKVAVSTSKVKVAKKPVDDEEDV